MCLCGRSGDAFAYAGYYPNDLAQMAKERSVYMQRIKPLTLENSVKRGFLKNRVFLFKIVLTMGRAFGILTERSENDPSS